MPGEPAAVSVIISAYTFDRWDELVAAVRSALAQTLPPAEVLVVVDNNDELLAQATAELPEALVVPNDQVPGLSGARMTVA